MEITPELVTAFAAGTVAIITVVGKILWNTFKGLVDMVNDIKDKQIEFAKDQKVIKSEVKNTHPQNLREDMDEKHAEQMLLLTKMSNHIQQIDKNAAADREYSRQEFNNVWKRLNQHHAPIKRRWFKR